MPSALCADEPLTRYGAFFGSIGSDAVVTLNGFPVFAGEPGEQLGRTETLNRFLKEGENRLVIDTLDIFVPEEGAIETEEGSVNSIQFRLVMETIEPGATEPVVFLQMDRQFTFATDQFVAGREVVEIQGRDGWESELGASLNDQRRSRIHIDADDRTYTFALIEGGVPNSVAVSFHLDSFPFSTLPWEDDLTLPNGEETESLRQFVLALHTAFVSRNTNSILDLLEPKLERMATSLGLPLAEVETGLRASYEQLVFAIAGLTFSPINEANIEFIPIGEERNLVEARVLGEPPIRAASAELAFDLRLYFSKVDGLWRLVE